MSGVTDGGNTRAASRWPVRAGGWVMASGVASFAVFAAMILVLAAVPSRLLGVRFSLGRAVLTGWAGLAVGFGVGYLVTRGQPGITPITPLGMVSAAGAAMVLTGVVALLSRSGGGSRTGGPLRRWLALVWTVRSTRRYLQLARIAAWHGLAGLFGGRSDPGTPGSLPGGFGWCWSRPARSLSSSA